MTTKTTPEPAAPAAAPSPAPLTANDRQTLLQAALVGLNASLTVFQHYGILNGVQLPAASGLPLNPLPMAPVQQAPLSVPVGPVASAPATPGLPPMLGDLQAPQAAPQAPAAKPKPNLPPKGPGGRFLKRTAAAATPALPGMEAPVTQADPPAPKAPKAPKPEPAYKPPTAPNTVEAFVAAFITGPEKDIYSVKRGGWEWIKGEDNKKPEDRRAAILAFHSQSSVSDGTVAQDQAAARHIICIRPIGGQVPIFNASRVRYGASWAAQQNPQAMAEKYGAVPVPFESVIDKKNGAGMDPAQMEVLDWTGSEDMVIPPVQAPAKSDEFRVCLRHFAGAVCLRVEKAYFLFDTDREELRFHNFNPFFTQLPGPAKTVTEAYELLMPDPVKKALADHVDVIRQGEFFFVKVPDAEVVGDLCTDEYNRRVVEVLTARADALGAAVVNLRNQMRLELLEDRVEKYPVVRPAEGSDHDQWIPNIIEATAYCEDYLGKQVGPKEAWLAPKKKEKKRDPYAAMQEQQLRARMNADENHGGTHLDPYREELQVRLHPEHGGDRAIGLRFAQVVDGVSETTGRRGNGHMITLTRVKGDATYGRGVVLHRGRDHRPVHLPGWYRVYANSALNNWTV